MNIEEKNINNGDVPYQCDFVLLSRKDNFNEVINVSGVESVESSLTGKTAQKLIE